MGGFDERFGTRPAGEDTDLAWRAIESGVATAFAPDAVVHHAVERIGARRMLRIAARWGPAVRILADHPQTRAWLYRRVFWNVWHYLLLRSLLALFGPAWLRRMLIARHLRELRARARRSGAGASAIPFPAGARRGRVLGNRARGGSVPHPRFSAEDFPGRKVRGLSLGHAWIPR